MEVIEGIVCVIVVGCLIDNFSDHIMDCIKPERLKRFDTKNYKDGVKDATRKVKIEIGDTDET